MMMNNKMSIRNFLARNIVIILFILVSTVAIPYSGYTGPYLVQEVITRLGRDAFLVLALLLPVMAGMGIFSFVLIGLLCALTVWFRETKLGQEMRAIGQDMGVSATAGINVDKTRIIAMVISTTLAGFGQLISIQNIGTLSTNTGADTLALYAAAALLVGGATVNKASIPNVFVGTALFHLMFVVMPLASNNFFGSAIIGEYSRTFISYAVVSASLALHAWNRARDKELSRINLRASNR